MRTKKKALQICKHMMAGGKVLVKDKHDHVVKESSIVAVYSDETAILGDTIHCEYKIKDLTIIPPLK